MDFNSSKGKNPDEQARGVSVEALENVELLSPPPSGVYIITFSKPANSS